jgi:cell division protein FtsA
MVNKEICTSGYRTRLNAGIVITGGSALLAHMVEMAEQIFDLPVRIGYPRGIGGRAEEVDSPRCTTAVGLLLYGSQILRSGTRGSSGVREKLKKWVKNIV